MRAVDIIEKKRDNLKLSDTEIEFLLNEYWFTFSKRIILCVLTFNYVMFNNGFGLFLFEKER